ncbi:lamin tail domain-containing protein [Aestuariibaculum lutulentum]|uniref:Lamin tail domain-containing protein n=1 Tax=Aestuariibaculum lutulentum TaxID=2920935 RepID=A0ABS9RFS8_9FLAO|nr:lamin tail domain-containing protein [Aestuariibaculum lutulentum]MCH4551800.1 lamin tail domain-containing protein [Aestuariibaculum lutulentum]
MKKLYFLLFTFLITSLSFAQNVVINGDFESWTGGALDTWTSESGTTITQETTTVSEGTYAANFELTTATQGDTDFRQTITVTNGNTYDVSVKVYHTDNESQVRIYAGDYRGYSDETLINEWQTITYQYVATADGPIEFGLRFYDVSATFDGSSTIIIDDYQVIESTPPSSCFNLSTGSEKFESVPVTVNSGSSSEWTESSGTYSVNGYCGSGCVEEVESWLVFGPLDLTSVTDLTLSFNASESFGTTDLNINYTNSYSGCPSGTSWTTAQSITDAGSIVVNLSTASGTTVFIGIQYLDDGVDGYSSWELSNIILDATNCPVLGSRPTSDCGTCDLVFGTETYNCQSNTAGNDNDSVIIEIPYTGIESNSNLSTTSGGTIGGDSPSTTTDGTITISGLSEGDSWDLLITGGDCDGTTISGTIPSAICDPLDVDLIINEILADPDAATGDANGDGIIDTSDDEFVEIYNNGTSSVDLSDYTLEDGVALRHTFPASTILPANSFITIFGGGTPTNIPGLSQVASSGALGLNNGGDTVTLKNPSDVVVVTYTYGGEGGDNQSISREPDFTGDFVLHTLIVANSVQFSPGAKNDGTALSNKNFDIAGFKMFPNPTSLGFVNVTAKSTSLMDIAVFDLLGKQVIKQSVSNKLDVSNLKSGVYIMKITQDDAVSTRKLVIK